MGQRSGTAPIRPVTAVADSPQCNAFAALPLAALLFAALYFFAL
jgi:hypothetical protein